MTSPAMLSSIVPPEEKLLRKSFASLVPPTALRLWAPPVQVATGGHCFAVATSPPAKLFFLRLNVLQHRSGNADASASQTSASETLLSLFQFFHMPQKTIPLFARDGDLITPHTGKDRGCVHAIFEAASTIEEELLVIAENFGVQFCALLAERSPARDLVGDRAGRDPEFRCGLHVGDAPGLEVVGDSPAYHCGVDHSDWSHIPLARFQFFQSCHYV